MIVRESAFSGSILVSVAKTLWTRGFRLARCSILYPHFQAKGFSGHQNLEPGDNAGGNGAKIDNSCSTKKEAGRLVS